MANLTIDDIKATIEVIFKQRVSNLISIGKKGRVLFCRRNSNIENIIGIIKNFSDNLREKILTLRAEKVLKILEISASNSRRSPESVIKNLKQFTLKDSELKIKIPEKKFNFNFPCSNNAQEKHLLSSLITSMREHGFKGRFFSLGAFGG